MINWESNKHTFMICHSGLHGTGARHLYQKHSYLLVPGIKIKNLKQEKQFSVGQSLNRNT